MFFYWCFTQIRFSTTVSLRIPARKQRRNSRKGKRVVLLRSAGRLLDTYMPYVQYKSTVPQKDIASKQKELDVEANALISRGGKVSCNIYLI
ncbi:hypothetical protein DVH24_025513 [Malus domestica]|uniref:Uncharacterized protein n=1 Tax=Malus domestica TaxID=3750 RepID=A0A498HQ15_MALDO|nr:hypothetical protein DVH24_025513 [Malus domestica]